MLTSREEKIAKRLESKFSNVSFSFKREEPSRTQRLEIRITNKEARSTVSTWILCSYFDYIDDDDLEYHLTDLSIDMAIELGKEVFLRRGDK